MYVCICNALRSSQIEAAARRGAATVEAAYAACDSQICCGTCREDAEEILAGVVGEAMAGPAMAAE